MAIIGFVAALFSLLIAGAIFKTNPQATKVPVVDALSPSFPDVKNDSTYQSFLNENALDPTQPIQIGNTKNSNPFNKQ